VNYGLLAKFQILVLSFASRGLSRRLVCAAALEMNEGTRSGKSTICHKAVVLWGPQTAFTFTFTFVVPSNTTTLFKLRYDYMFRAKNTISRQHYKKHFQENRREKHFM
jgi:hypothetical protein